MKWQLAFEYLRRHKGWRKASWIPLLAVAVLADESRWARRFEGL